MRMKHTRFLYVSFIVCVCTVLFGYLVKANAPTPVQVVTGPVADGHHDAAVGSVTTAADAQVTWSLHTMRQKLHQLFLWAAELRQSGRKYTAFVILYVPTNTLLSCFLNPCFRLVGL
jgi:hypothetical protein